MGFLTRVGDTVYTFRFLRLLTMDWTKMEAYKLGLIDANGKRIKKPETPEEKSAYTFFHRLVFNFKRMLNIIPAGKWRALTSYASALYLLKASTEHDEETILEHTGLGLEISEDEDTKPLLISRQYQLNKPIMIPFKSDSEDLVAESGSIVTITKDMGIHFGTVIYEAVHKLTGQTIYVSAHDIATDLFREEFSVSTADVDLTPTKGPNGDKYMTFKVPTGLFQRFNRGKAKFKRWSTFLDLNDEVQSKIAAFAKKNRDAVIILQDESTGATRAIRPIAVPGL